MSWSWTSNTYEGRCLKLSISETVNWGSNTSTLNWTLTSEGGNVSYYAVGETSVTINGVEVYHNDAMGYSNHVFPVAKGSKSGSLIINHDANGAKSVAISFKTRVYYTAAEEYAGDNIALTTILKYTVSYNANGGLSTPSSQTKIQNVAIKLRAAISRNSSTKNGYTITFDMNGGKESISPKTAIDTVTYSFDGWNTNQSGTGTNYSAGSDYTKNASVTLYAKWGSKTTKGHITLPIPTRNGYSFKGWATSANAVSGITGTYTPNNNITLYAIWEAKGLVHIDNGQKWEDYQIYVDDGSAWNLCIPYIDDGSKWNNYS